MTTSSGGIPLPGWAWCERTSGELKTESLATSKLPGYHQRSCYCRHPLQKTSPVGLFAFFQRPLQPMTESQWCFDHPVVAVEQHHVSCTVPYSLATITFPEMRLEGRAQIRIY